MTHCLVNYHISGHLVSVLVSAECVIMYPAIANHASYGMVVAAGMEFNPDIFQV
jgi:hypothetical protein